MYSDRDFLAIIIEWLSITCKMGMFTETLGNNSRQYRVLPCEHKARNGFEENKLPWDHCLIHQAIQRHAEVDA